MKKIIIAVVFLMLISPVFAQDTTPFYYVNVSIEKIYSTSQGFIVMYRTQKGVETIGVPNRWFNESAGRADIVNLPSGFNWPTMSIFYREGEFSNVRLYVHRSKGHITWGNVPQGTDVSSYFPDGDTFDLKF